MESTRFDRLTRMMARATTRRGALKTMAAGTVGGAALMTASSSHAQTADGEEWVQLYEEMAAAVDTIDGACSNVADAMQAFQMQNADRFQQMQEETAAYAPEQVAAHQQAYGPRVQQASIAIQLALTRCGYVEVSDSPHSLADVNADYTPATPGATPGAIVFGTSKSIGGPDLMLGLSGQCQGMGNGADYCNCTCNNTFTVGNCALFMAACAFGGCASPPNCCWSGICVAGFDHDRCVQQCLNCVNVQVSGSNCG